MTQIANSLDSVTKEKAIKGLLIALTGGVAVGITAWLVGVDAAKVLLLAVISTLVPTAVNTAREYKAGN